MDIFSWTICLIAGLRFYENHTLCMQAAKAQASLHICTGLPEPALLNDVVSNTISCGGSYYSFFQKNWGVQ